MTSSHESAAARPLALIKPPDLVAFAQTLGGRAYVGLKDPLALRYYHLRPEEYFVLQQLDGRTSAEQIQAAFEREFAPRKLGLGQLQSFCSLLYREGLLVADAAGQGERRALLRKLWGRAPHIEKPEHAVPRSDPQREAPVALWAGSRIVLC